MNEETMHLIHILEEAVCPDERIEQTALEHLIEQAMPNLIQSMYDSSVRDTAASTIRSICEIIPEAAINETFLKPLLESLITGLKAEPRVASNLCLALRGLTEAAYEDAGINEETGQLDTYCLSQFFEFLVESLLDTIQRQDGEQDNLRPVAYDALLTMVKNSPKDCSVIAQKTIMVIMQQTMPNLIALMYDSSVIVKDSAVSSIRRICEIFPDAAVNEPFLKPLLESLVTGLKAEPRVASNLCLALRGLTEAAYEDAEINEETGQLDTYCLSQFFEFLVESLLDTIQRQDGEQDNLRPVAYDALLTMVKNSPKDCSVIAQKTIMVIMQQAMPNLIALMYDSSVIVRDSAVLSIRRICEIFPDAAVNEPFLKPLLESLVTGLKAQPRVASNVCLAFISLAEAAYKAAKINKETGQPDSYSLSLYFEIIIDRLLETTHRPEGEEDDLRSTAYYTLEQMVKYSPKDCCVTVQKTTMVILERLQHILQMKSHTASDTDQSEYNDLQSLLCHTLRSVLDKVTASDVLIISDTIMSTLLSMFRSCNNGGVQEDALITVSTLVQILGENFLKYMDAFKPFLHLGLRNHQEYHICDTAVGLTGNIFIALKQNALPYCDELITLLLENLSNNSVHPSVKPQILSVFGDMVHSLGAQSKKYLGIILTTLAHISQTQVDRNDFDMIDYLDELREGILDAYSGILQGLEGDSPTPHPDIKPHVPFIINCITKVAEDDERSDSTLAVAAGLVGDLCSVFGASVLPLLDLEIINDMLCQGRSSHVINTKTLATSATEELSSLKLLCDNKRC